MNELKELDKEMGILCTEDTLKELTNGKGEDEDEQQQSC